LGIVVVPHFQCVDMAVELPGALPQVLMCQAFSLLKLSCYNEGSIWQCVKHKLLPKEFDYNYNAIFTPVINISNLPVFLGVPMGGISRTAYIFPILCLRHTFTSTFLIGKSIPPSKPKSMGLSTP
jgi:hypothetical protein